MIELKNLSKSFGDFRAVRDISFQVRQGEVLGFLGPNGAGKTTTMRMITGFLPPSSGSIHVEGFDLATQAVEARRRIGYLPENAPLYADMTVTEFLRFIGDVRGFRGAERSRRVDQAIDRCFLHSVRHQSIETLSKGYRQRTCFAQALLHDPAVLLLDEPTDGLDPNQKKVVRDMIAEMSATKVIMLSTHILEEVDAVCTRAIIISRGSIVEDDKPAELKKKSRNYNRVTLSLEADPDQARQALASLDPVSAASIESSQEGSAVIRLDPREGLPITAAALELCRQKKWPVTAVHTDPGRLDDVFQEHTETADTQVKSSKGVSA